MKAYLIRHSQPLHPFQKPASAIRFGKHTIRERLEAQLRQQGFRVIDQNTLDLTTVDARSIVLHDNLLLSDSFLAQLKNNITDRQGNYRCEIETSRFPLLCERDTATSYRELPLFYVGNPRQRDTSNNVTWQPLRLLPTTLHEVAEGMPVRMHQLSQLRLFFLDYFAIPVEFWFDLQVATSLYCREFIANMIQPARTLLPDWLVDRALTSRWLMEHSNRIGRHCRIHPTAILEGCVIGDNVEIGPFAYLRSTVVENGAVIRERSSLKMAYIGPGAFIMGSDVVNSYVGAESAIITPMLYNTVFGERSFISGGSGFADFTVGSGQIRARVDDKDIASGLSFLGSCVGDDCFIGANMIFAPGKAIPDGSRFLDNGLINAVPNTSDATYVISGNHCIQIPDSFLGATSS